MTKSLIHEAGYIIHTRSGGIIVLNARSSGIAMFLGRIGTTNGINVRDAMIKFYSSPRQKMFTTSGWLWPSADPMK